MSESINNTNSLSSNVSLLPDHSEKILVVDDEKLHLHSLMTQIAQHGYSVDSVTSGEAAINRLKQRKTGIILLDLHLDGLTGEDVMRFISENKINTTVIVVSGESSFEAAENALKHGAYDYIRKPYSIDNLLNSISNAIKKRQLEADNLKMQTQLRDSERLHRYIVNKSPDIVYILDGHGRFTFINERVETLLGYTTEEVIGKHYTELIHDDDLEKAEFKFNERRTGTRSGINIELKLKCKNNLYSRSFDNRILPIEVNSMGVYSSLETQRDQNFIGTYGIARDITDRIEAEEMILFQAYHDMLTHLPNRTLLKDRLNQAISIANRNNKHLSIMLLDLDRFKMINDTLGHVIGDHLLRSVAMRLRHCLREGDTLARLGGDEFTLLLPEVKSREEAGVIAEKIIKSLMLPFKIENHELFISASIGISHYPNDGTSMETLMKHADIAMYSVKGRGKNNYQFYNDNMIEAYSKHLSMESDLRRALEENQFKIFYQPQINIESNKIIAMEALIRWQHPDRGLISPIEFIGFAEETHLIKQIGNWVLTQACIELKRWQSNGSTDIRMAVNVSAVQLEQDNFVELVLESLKQNQLPGDSLEIEITENTLMHDADDGINKLRELSDHGIKIAIDDFGTGYSSLNYLKRLPIDTLKIDQSFVHDITNSDGDPSIIKAIIAMADGLSLNLISEGVENEAQLDKLKEWNCKVMQGFLFSHPIPSNEAMDMLQSNEFIPHPSLVGNNI